MQNETENKWNTEITDKNETKNQNKKKMWKIKMKSRKIK